MEHKQNVLDQLLMQLPRKILLLHGYDNVTEFVIHELCNSCFHIEKAAYFVDNPDFDCFKGVTGFCASEAYKGSDDIWNNPQVFTSHMQQSPFNQKVRSIFLQSMKKRNITDDEIVKNVAEQLGIEKPSFCDWNMRYDNHGIFVYQDLSHNDIVRNEDFVNGLCLLSFCPIY